MPSQMGARRGCMKSGKNATKEKVSLASPRILIPTAPSPASNVEGERSDTRKNRRYVQLIKNPDNDSQKAVSVPKSGPESMLAATKIAGKCLTRQRSEARKSDTVCSGTSCLRETRNAASRATKPWIGVGLDGSCQYLGQGQTAASM